MLIDRARGDELRREYALTARQIEYIKLLFKGVYDNQELADKAGNTLLTAKIHITHIYKKLNVSNKVSIVLKIIEYLKLLPYDLKNPPETILENFKNRYNLTNREIELIKIICRGITENKEIGKAMHLDFRGAINYLMNIYRKTFTHSKLTLLLKFISFSDNSGDFLNEESDAIGTAENSGSFSNFD